MSFAPAAVRRALRHRPDEHARPTVVTAPEPPAVFSALWVINPRRQTLLTERDCHGRQIWGPPALVAVTEDDQGYYAAALRASREALGIQLSTLTLGCFETMDLGYDPAETQWYIAKLLLAENVLPPGISKSPACRWIDWFDLRAELTNYPERFPADAEQIFTGLHVQCR